MKKLLFFVCLIVGFTCFAQNSEKKAEEQYIDSLYKLILFCEYDWACFSGMEAFNYYLTGEDNLAFSDEHRAFLLKYKDEVLERVFDHFEKEGQWWNGHIFILGFYKEKKALPYLRKNFIECRYIYGWEGGWRNALADDECPFHHTYEEAIKNIMTDGDRSAKMSDLIQLTQQEIDTLTADYRKGEDGALYVLYRLKPEIAVSEIYRKFKQKEFRDLSLTMLVYFYVPPLGLSKNETKELLGNPDQISINGNLSDKKNTKKLLKKLDTVSVEEWLYEAGSGGTLYSYEWLAVKFQKGQVIGVDRLFRQSRSNDFEDLGFQAILSKNIKDAIHNFTEAEKCLPIYHNVAEIKKLLILNRQKVMRAEKAGNCEPWYKIYKIILSHYSWGMPERVEEELQNQVKCYDIRQETKEFFISHKEILLKAIEGNDYMIFENESKEVYIDFEGDYKVWQEIQKIFFDNYPENEAVKAFGQIIRCMQCYSKGQGSE